MYIMSHVQYSKVCFCVSLNVQMLLTNAKYMHITCTSHANHIRTWCVLNTNHLPLLTAPVFTDSEGPAVRRAEGRFDWSVCELCYRWSHDTGRICPFGEDYGDHGVQETLRGTD